MKLRLFFAAFERDVFDDFDDVMDLLIRELVGECRLHLGFEKLFGCGRSDGFIAVVKFGIGDVVQQSGEFYHHWIYRF